MGDTDVSIPVNLGIPLVLFEVFCLGLGLTFGVVFFLRSSVKKKVPKGECNSVFSHKDNVYTK